MSSKSVVSVQNITIYQESKMVMEEIHFDIIQGEFVYLIGKTGSGKSSILKTMYADLEINQGVLSIVGYDIGNIERKDIPFLRRKLGIIFQDFELFTDRSVEENLLFVLKATGWKDKKKMDKRIDEVLGQVFLEGKREKLPHQLSGGEQQRVAIARALLNNPEVILADEPTGNLDPVVAYEILQLFIDICKKGTAVLMATHHHNFLKKFPARVIYCENQGIKDVPKETVIQRFVG